MTVQLSHAQAERLQFIEDSLFWVGRVGNSDVRNRFGVSKAQAADDIARYRKSQPAPVLYDPNLKAFVAPDSLKPLYASQDFDRFFALAQREDLVEGEIVDLAVLQPPSRRVVPELAQAVIRALLNAEEIEVDYISLSSGATRRWITPHALASDGLRIHVRAYDHAKSHFADFVLGRIQSVVSRRPRTVDIEADDDWFEIVPIELVPNPRLSGDRRKVLMVDFGFEDDVLVYRVRRSMLIYLNTRMLLHSELAGMPREEVYRQLVPRDQLAFDQLLDQVIGKR